MNYIKIFFKKYRFILTGIIFVVLLFTLIVSNLSKKKSIPKINPTPIVINPSLYPTSNIAPTGLQNVVGQHILTVPEERQLTQEEQKFPEATPQIYPGKNINKTGTIIITSEPSDATVVLDTPESESESNYTLPQNKTPFKVTKIPVGTYDIGAFKFNYDYTNARITIVEGSVITLHLKLRRLP